MTKSAISGVGWGGIILSQVERVNVCEQHYNADLHYTFKMIPHFYFQSSGRSVLSIKVFGLVWALLLS